MIHFMGARFDPYPAEIISSRLVDFLYADQTKFVTTPNPEMLLLARKNPELAEVLKGADLGCIDGTGVVGVLKAKNIHGVERVSGVDVLAHCASLCEQHGKKLMLVGGGPGVAAEAKRALMKQHPELDAHSYIGPNMSYKIETAHPYAKDDEEVISEILDFKPDVLAVALGAEKQELWLAQYRDRFSDVKIVIGVGGALDMISGSLPRAPLFLRKIGLEWLWRLILQPKRIVRIFRAVVIFPIVAFRHKIIY